MLLAGLEGPAGISGLPQDWQYRLCAGFGVLQLLQMIVSWFILAPFQVLLVFICTVFWFYLLIFW